MTLDAELKPFLKLISFPVQGEEVLEIVIGEKEIRYPCGFLRIKIGAALVVPMIEIEV